MDGAIILPVADPETNTPLPAGYRGLRMGDVAPYVVLEDGSYVYLMRSNATLAALAGLTIAANSITIGTGPDAFSQVTFAANTLPARASTGDLEAKPISDYSIGALNYADEEAWRAGLALGSAAQSATTDFDSAGSAATAQSNAIATASVDATTKANTAQANAATYTDTQLLAEGRRLFTISLLGH